MTKRQPVPTFYLYGEPHRSVDEGFIHVEDLCDRSRPSEWTIKPHAHAELCHIFVITSGGGAMKADDRDISFSSPCLLIVPAMTIHGFVWEAESSGTVITMSTRYIKEVARRDEGFGRLFDDPSALLLNASDNSEVRRLTASLGRELGWSAPGHHAAVDAAMISILVILLRNTLIETARKQQRGPHAAVVARLRERIEQRFRLREGVKQYAAALGVSETALRVACARVANTAPAQMLDERSLLEARRSLLYSNLSIAEIGYSLGFSDPAYFSRFFTRHAGVPPSAYRDLGS